MDLLPPMNKISFMVLQHKRRYEYSTSEDSNALTKFVDSQRFKGKSYGS